MQEQAEFYESKFFSEVIKTFSERIMFYCVTGSTARKEFIENWSDLDIVLGLDTLSLNDLYVVQSVISNVGSPIKIGLTIYSLSELENIKLLDRKSVNTLYNIQIGTYVTRIMKINNLPTVTMEILTETNSHGVPEYTHQMKRELMLGLEKFNEKKVYKIITYLSRFLYLKTEKVWIDGAKKILGKNITTEKNWLVRIVPEDIIEKRIPVSERVAIYEFFLINFLKEYSPD